jgi:hypothetical protein
VLPSGTDASSYRGATEETSKGGTGKEEKEDRHVEKTVE